MDTALHEILGHATFDWARGNAPELYAKMREYAAGAPEEVKSAIRDAYPDVAEGSAAWEDEVFAHLIAADNEDLIRSRVLGEAGVSWLGKVRAWFGRLWRRFVRALGGSASEDLDVRAIAGMDAKAGMRRLVESALAGKRLGTWSAEARERGNVVSPERERFYSRAAEGTRRARAETASKLNEELEAWKNRYAELLSFGGMALSADARDANYERARLERAKDAESRRRAVNTEERRNRESPAFKSATLNVGAYAPENPDIRYSVLRKRGKYVDERVRVRFRRATAGGRPPFRSCGVPFLCGRKRVSGRAWRRCGAGRAPFLPGRRRR